MTLFILCTYLISNSELREIAKLPVLFQHFQEHKLLDKGITFSAYLFDHYNSVPHTDNDAERDNQLPFKSIDLSILLTPAVPQWYYCYFQKPVRLIDRHDTFTYQQSYLLEPSEGKIWQPPKSDLFLIS